MKSIVFSGRNWKELARNPASILCGVGLPVLLIITLSAMKRLIPGMSETFSIDKITPGMAVFSLSFLSMLLGILMTNDKKYSFLLRLFSTPMASKDYIIGYALPVFPLAIIQTLLCFGAGFAFGLPLHAGVLTAMLVLLPVAALYISFGLFIGIALNSENQVSGFITLFINATVFLGGVVIPLEQIGGIFQKICYILPFVHATAAMKNAISKDYASIPSHLLWVTGYTLIIIFVSSWVFKKRMKQ